MLLQEKPILLEQMPIQHLEKTQILTQTFVRPRKVNNKSLKIHFLSRRIFMSEKKKVTDGKETSKKTEVVVTKKEPTAISKPSKKKSALAPAAPSDLWQAFDETFARFRNDFEDLLFPANWAEPFSLIPETRVPAVDLEDHEKDYLLKAEMPGFKKEDIEIEVQDNAVTITGTAGWKYDKKAQAYICKERACESFYRMVELPEEIKVDDVSANLSEGVLEITLPKKTPKQKRKVAVK
jgi:HSP20 family protein